jgi:hypothetical protein
MNWHYVYGAVWTTPLGPEDGGQCVAVRASKSNLEPTEKDAALRLMAAAPELLAALQALTDWGRDHTSPKDPNSPHALLVAASAAIARATGKD